MLTLLFTPLDLLLWVVNPNESIDSVPEYLEQCVTQLAALIL